MRGWVKDFILGEEKRRDTRVASTADSARNLPLEVLQARRQQAEAARQDLIARYQSASQRQSGGAGVLASGLGSYAGLGSIAGTYASGSLGTGPLGAQSWSTATIPMDYSYGTINPRVIQADQIAGGAITANQIIPTPNFSAWNDEQLRDYIRSEGRFAPPLQAVNEKRPQKEVAQKQTSEEAIAELTTRRRKITP